MTEERGTDLPDRFVWTYGEIPNQHIKFSEDAEPEMSMEYVEYQYEGDRNWSESTLERIRDAIDSQYTDPDTVFPGTIVLGVEEYLDVDAWIQYDSDGDVSIEDVLPADIVTVPGSMIHVPKKNRQALMDRLKEADGR